jgi:heme/copper-type cytochrome/quinol oxidase subunit 2
MIKLSKNIIEKIQKEGIRPVPKWHFLLKNYVIWGLFGISVFIGSIAFSITLFRISDIDWDIPRKIHGSLFEWIGTLTPFFWIIVLLVFLYVAYHNLKHTKKGYKLNTFLVLGLSILLSLLIGGVMFATGISNRMEQAFEKNIPFYSQIHSPRQRMWMMLEKGLMAGRITDIREDDIDVQSLKGAPWVVDIRNAKLNGIEKLEKNLRVGIIGKKLDERRFEAKEIRPWEREMVRLLKIRENMKELSPPPRINR